MSVEHSSRKIAAASIAVMSLVALAGCGSGTPGQTADSASTDKVTVTFWHRNFTPAENEWYDGIVKAFNEAQDEVFVEDTEIPTDAWDQKIKAGKASGQMPDIYTHSGTLNDDVNADQLYPLDEVMSKEAIDAILPAAEPISKMNGHTYVYPLLQEPQTVLFWNKDMLAKAGVDTEKAPETWQDLLDNCEKIKPTLSEGQFCIAPALNAVDMAWSTVGQQFNAAGHIALTDDWTAPNIADQGYSDLLDFYAAMWNNEYVPKPPLAAYVEGSDYGQQKVAYKVSGSWMMSEIASDYPDLVDKTGVGKFPSSPNADGRTATTMGNFAWAIDARSTHAEAAAKFIEWAIASDPERVLPFFVNTKYTKVPVRQDFKDAVAASDGAKDAPWSEVVMNSIAVDAIAEPAYPWDVTLAVGTMMESVMKGGADKATALSTAESTITQVIDREKLPEKAPTAE